MPPSRPDTHPARLARLEAEGAIRQMLSRYALALDDRDMPALAGLFAPDARLRWSDGQEAAGLDAVMASYRSQLGWLGVCGHYMHQWQIDALDAEDGIARGRLRAHAEVEMRGRTRIIGLLYEDAYRRTAEGWRIAERAIDLRYNLPVARLIEYRSL
jgi:ketosteroid isomerase-like protein